MHLAYLLAATSNGNGGGGPSVTINAWVIFLTSFVSAVGISAWKLLPWIIKQALDEKIDSKLLPMVSEVHERIDSHMNTEEDSFVVLSDSLDGVRSQLASRTELFDDLQATLSEVRDVLQRHMDADEIQFALGTEALTKGQHDLIEELTAIKRALGLSAERIEAAVAATQPDPGPGDSFS